MIEQVLPKLARDIHRSNVDAGWWSDVETGESILHQRNRGEIMMLMVTELSEACDGFDGRKDDHLPQYPMYQVEVADYVIRALDLLGAEEACGHAMPEFIPVTEYGYLREAPRHNLILGLMRSVAHAMEHYRKRRMDDYLRTIADSVSVCYAMAGHQGFVLSAALNDKWAYNKTRADHTMEARRADGGKKC